MQFLNVILLQMTLCSWSDTTLSNMLTTSKSSLSKIGDIFCFLAAELLLSSKISLWVFWSSPDLEKSLNWSAYCPSVFQSYFYASTCVNVWIVVKWVEHLNKSLNSFQVKKNSVERVNIWIVFNCEIDICFKSRY